MATPATQTTIDAYLAALAARADVAPFLAADVVLTLVDAGREIRGQETVAAAIADLHRRAFDARPEAVNVVAAEETAAGEFLFAGTHTGEFAGIPATGRAVRVPYAVFYDLAGERIAAVRIHGFASGFVAQVTAEASVPVGAAS